MLGAVLNTHQPWMCRVLAGHGYLVARQAAIPDDSKNIREAVREALSRADLVITTGGLGPTSDDLTRDLIAELLGRKLKLDASVMAHIESFFAGRKRVMPASSKVQALVPEGATVLPNLHGTAPGLLLEVSPGQFRQSDGPSFLIMLPGPPRELRPMFIEVVVPWLKRQFPQSVAFASHTFKTTGIGESLLEEAIAPSLQPLIASGLEIGYCARIGEVDVRLSARGPQANGTVEEACALVRRLAGEYIFGCNDDQLEAVVIRHLAERRQTLALAESCTGGFISNRLTNVSGASAVFQAGMVTYSNKAKESLLGVQPETLAKHGAVSEPVAREMAEGARARSEADFALAVTGIAGPTGGAPEKPVGTVFIALAGPQGTVVLQRLNSYDRETFKYVTSQQALELLRRTLAGISTSAS